MSLAAIVEALVAAGATPEQILAAVQASERAKTDALAARRAMDAERQRRCRERRHAMSRDVTVTERDTPSPEKGPTPQKTNPYPEVPPSPPSGAHGSVDRAAVAEFEVWYRAYPHKVGRKAAQAAYLKARRTASAPVLLSGVQAYIASKPPDRPWCNPATWLNQERWCDAPDMTPQLTLVHPHVRNRQHQHPVKQSLDDLSARFAEHGIA